MSATARGNHDVPTVAHLNLKQRICSYYVREVSLYLFHWFGYSGLLMLHQQQAPNFWVYAIKKIMKAARCDKG